MYLRLLAGGESMGEKRFGLLLDKKSTKHPPVLRAHPYGIKLQPLIPSKSNQVFVHWLFITSIMFTLVLNPWCVPTPLPSMPPPPAMRTSSLTHAYSQNRTVPKPLPAHTTTLHKRVLNSKFYSFNSTQLFCWHLEPRQKTYVGNTNNNKWFI